MATATIKTTAVVTLILSRKERDYLLKILNDPMLLKRDSEDQTEMRTSIYTALERAK